jgi:hypothetical protein
MHKPAAKHGGVNKKMKKYPRIIDYLQAHHPEVYDLIEDLAMHGNLTPKRGGAVTFLLPDSAYIKEIKKAAESEEPEKATDMLSSLIIPDLFSKPEDFKAKGDDIPNLLDKKITVKSITPTKVEIDNGELTLDTKFHPFVRQGKSKRGNMAIWLLKGKVEYEKAPAASMKYIRGAKKGAGIRHYTRGGHDDAHMEVQQIARKVIEEKITALAMDKKSDDGKIYCPMLNAVVCVLRGFEEKCPDEYRSAHCLLTMCPMIDFFILYCNPLVFCPQAILEARKVGVERDNNVDYYKRFCSSFDASKIGGDPALLLTEAGAEQVNHARDAVRTRLLSNVNTNLASKILDMYNKVDSSNSLEGVGPIYPKVLADVFSRNRGLHLLIDEVSNGLYFHVQHIRELPTPREKAEHLKIDVGDFILAFGWDVFCNPEKKTRLDKAIFYDGKDVYKIVTPFLSTFGLHMPCMLGHEFEHRVIMGAGEVPDMYSRDLYDVDHHILQDLDSYDNCPLCVSDKSMAEMRAYMKTHGGQLPDSLRTHN